MPVPPAPRPVVFAQRTRTLIFGCGYLGSRVAQQLLATDGEVVAVTRSAIRARELAQAGLTPWIADWNDRRTLRGLPEHGRVLVAVAHSPQTRFSRYETQVLGFRNALLHTDPKADLSYISSTGVYHQTDGRWVDENSPCHPRREGGRTHLEAESLLHRERPGGPWTILRLAGIYGPDRVPRVHDVMAGRPIASPRQGYLNLIHVEDATAAVIATWRAGPASRQHLYAVSDGHPVIRETFYREIARLSGGPEPSFVDPPANAPVSARSESNKRIWNARLRHDLLANLRFPSFREGLAAILQSRAS